MWLTVSIILTVLLVCGYFWSRTQIDRFRSEVARLKRDADIQSQHELERAAANVTHQTALFDSMIEGVLLLNGEDRVQMVNASLRKMFGINTDITGKTLMEAFRLHELTVLIGRLQDEGRVTEFEVESTSLSGRTLQINAVRLPGSSGRRSGSMLVFHDLTRINQLENGRREFVANVSHELRTPLSMIKGYVETLLDGAMHDETVAGKFLHTIDKHADRLTFLIEDLLTISRLESGQENMNFHTVKLHEVVDRVVEDLAQRAAERGVEITSTVDPQFTVEADAARLQQVFFNLIDNAIKYGGRDGYVRIAARSAAEPGYVDVSVADSGPGIPPEAAERIFERFFRVDKARSREQGGTGLGLSIVKHIVQAHGGEVWVDSGVGTGSQFHFTLRNSRD
jgi:two-component system phosphate regulon sensor histidine kinase PhoR